MIVPGSHDWNILEEMIQRLGEKVVAEAVEIIVENLEEDSDDFE